MDTGTMKTTKGRSPTIGDVARRAGVSPTTVSFVLNEVAGSGISEATTTRVRATARELRYRPNATARLLRTDRSHAIGFVTDEIASTPFAGYVIKGAQEAAWEAGKILMIVNTGENRKIEESAVGMMLERRVEGIIHAAMYHRAVEPPTPARCRPFCSTATRRTAPGPRWSPTRCRAAARPQTSCWAGGTRGWAS